MDENVAESLMELGFTSTEAKVYCTMVKEEKMNGYQIAKALNLSRSSVYAALENLLDKGAILSAQGESNDYIAIEPDSLIEKFVSRYKRNASLCKEKFDALSIKKRATNLFCNIQGKSNIIEEVRGLISRAKKEIVMTSSFPLDSFYDVLKDAIDRGVRVILFSFLKMDLMGLDIEFYGGVIDTPLCDCSDHRILVVTDVETAIIGSNDKNDYYTLQKIVEDEKLNFSFEDKAYTGIKSTNRLMVNIVLEHIHHDIYLQKLKTKYNKEIITPDIQIGSIMETGM